MTSGRLGVGINHKIVLLPQLFSSSSCWVHMFCVRQPHDTTMFGSGSAGALMAAAAAAAAPLQSLKRRRRESLEQEERRGQQYEDYSEENAPAKVFLFFYFPSRCTTTLQLN